MNVSGGGIVAVSEKGGGSTGGVARVGIGFCIGIWLHGRLCMGSERGRVYS